MTVYFERSTMLDKYLGAKYRFESIKIGATTESFKQSQKEVEKNIAEYIAELKDKEAKAEQARKSQAGTGHFEIYEPEISGTAQSIKEYKESKKLKLK